MIERKRINLLLLAAVAGFGFVLGSIRPGMAPAQAPGEKKEVIAPSAPAAYKAEVPPNRGLDANLYMQTAAEYRACCYQAYNLAMLRLTQGIEETKGKSGKLAVVMDLDETVLDNAGFQAMQLRSNLAYDDRLWEHWEEKEFDRLGLIPGAKEFILETEKLGVAVFHISNRNDKFKDQTKSALKRLGIPVRDDAHLKLATKTTDKTTRRQEVEKDYTVLLYVGDNLRDFDEKFRCRKLYKKSPEELEDAIMERKKKVEDHRQDWGKKWIILPNPAYGEWTKPLGMGRGDLDRLVPAVEKQQ